MAPTKKKRPAAVIDPEKLVLYQPVVDIIKKIYADHDFTIGVSSDKDVRTEDFEEAPEDFQLLSTIRYDPLLSDDFGMSFLIDPTMDSSKLFFLFEEHYQRFLFTMKYFKFNLDLQRDVLLQHLNKAISKVDPSNSYRLRVTISKVGDVEITVMNTPQRFNLLDGFESIENYHSPIWNVYIDKEPIFISPFTSFKTTRRQQYNAARERTLPKDSDITEQEVLLYNTASQITEGSITNIAIRRYNEITKQMQWYTPVLASGCLCGVVRHMLLSKGLIDEKLLFLKDIDIGDEVLLFNGLQGVVKGRIVG